MHEGMLFAYLVSLILVAQLARNKFDTNKAYKHFCIGLVKSHSPGFRKDQTSPSQASTDTSPANTKRPSQQIIIPRRSPPFQQVPQCPFP